MQDSTQQGKHDLKTPYHGQTTTGTSHYERDKYSSKVVTTGFYEFT